MKFKRITEKEFDNQILSHQIFIVRILHQYTYLLKNKKRTMTHIKHIYNIQ